MKLLEKWREIMLEKNEKEVNFHDFCPKCMHVNGSECSEPCDSCLEIGGRVGTRVPEKYEKRDKKEE